jgi:hypothetical protein
MKLSWYRNVPECRLAWLSVFIIIGLGISSFLTEPRADEVTNGARVKSIEKMGDGYEGLFHEFVGQQVQQYACTLCCKIIPLSVIYYPPEPYSEVVDVGKPLIPRLLILLDTGIVCQRLAAYYALCQISNQRYGTCQDYSSEVKHTVRDSLINIWRMWWEKNKTKDRVTWLINDLTSKDSTTAKRAAIFLGDCHDRIAIPHLRKTLSNNLLSFYSIESLAKLGDIQIVPNIIKYYLNHDNVGYRERGIKLLNDLTGHRFDFVPNAAKSERDKAIEKWQQWWKKCYLGEK